MEPLNKVVEEIQESFKKVGLYLLDANIATSDQDAMTGAPEGGDTKDFRDKLASGESRWLVSATFNIGDVAFSERVQDPEGFKDETEFLTVMPTEEELLRQRYIEAMESGDILSIYNLDPIEGVEDADSSDS